MRLLLFLVLALPAMGAEIRLAWTASPSTNVTGYMLYAGTNSPSITNVAERINAGTNQIIAISFVKSGSWFFWVTAHDSNGVESEPSSTLQVQVPDPPANLRTVLVEATIDLSSTNWAEKAFLRLRIP